MKRNKKYQAVLFSLDGDYVTDFKGRDSVEEVWDEINHMGSKWIFYPLCCVATDKSIVDHCFGKETDKMEFRYHNGRRWIKITGLKRKFIRNIQSVLRQPSYCTYLTNIAC